MTTPPRPSAAKAASITVIASRLILTLARSVASPSMTTSMLIAVRSFNGRRRQEPLTALTAELVRHPVDRALGDRHDLVRLGRGDHQRRREAQDVAVRHGAGDQALLEICRRDPRPDLERLVEAPLPVLEGAEVELRHQVHAPNV